MKKMLLDVSIVIFMSFLIGGCSQSSPSTEDAYAKYSLEKDIEFSNPGVDENDKHYKVSESLSEFTSMSESRKIVMDKANAFCAKDGKKMILTAEHISKLPYMINHNPNITITYVCQDLEHKKIQINTETEENTLKVKTDAKIEYDEMTQNIQTSKNKYKNLFIIKKLLDDGILTQEEFQKEKRNILLKD